MNTNVLKMFDSNAKINDKTNEKLKFPPYSVCKIQHAPWNCAVFNEKTPRLSKMCSRTKNFLLQGDHSFHNCSNPKRCLKPDCESTHIVRLHGAEKFFFRRAMKIPGCQVTILLPVDSASSHSRLSADLVKRLNLLGTPIASLSFHELDENL